MNIKTLNVYINSELVGNLEEHNGKKLMFKYLDDVKTPISLSMPISKDLYSNSIVRPFFENLLPEGDLLKVISTLYRVSENNPFSILSAIGEDCAGAIQITKNTYLDDSNPPKIVTEDDFKSIMFKAANNQAFYTKNMRLSLAGVQNKLTLLIAEDQYYLPTFRFPSTHIIKLKNTHFEDILLNEFFCTDLLNSLKVPTSKIALKTLDNDEYLLIERYDRIKSNGLFKRIHQEDFCQILSIYPSKKYQNEGGPSLKNIASAINTHTTYPIVNILLLAKVVVFNYLVGNCDYHGKNIAILHREDKTIALTPFYDIVSTSVYQELSTDLAMKINKKSQLNDLTRADFIKEFDSWGINGLKTLNLILNDFKNIVKHANEIISNNTLLQTSKIVLLISSIISSHYNKLND
ncbi:MAG: HipA domain-containing protein [Acholeplasma sp.]|nr:HipA domain-containing protein [Acholeplasma sp.]